MHTLTSASDPVRLRLCPLPKRGERLRFWLVYQAGIANVFQVENFNLAHDTICPGVGTGTGRKARRVYQGDFRTAESIAYGCGLAGALVMTSACNQAGDIQNAQWTDDLESQPFADKFHPVFFTIGF